MSAIAFAPLDFGHCQVQIDMAWSTSEAIDPDYTSPTAIPQAETDQYWYEFGEVSMQLDDEPLLMVMQNQSFKIRYNSLWSNVFNTANKRIGLRYRISWDNGATWEYANDCEVMLKSIGKEWRDQTDPEFDVISFTAADRVVSVLEKKTIADFWTAYGASEAVTTLYNSNNDNISSFITDRLNNPKAVSISGALSAIASLCGLTLGAVDTPFSIRNYGSTYTQLGGAYIMHPDSATLGLYGIRNTDKERSDMQTNRTGWMQFGTLKDLLKHLCVQLGVYPMTRLGLAADYSQQIDFIDRFGYLALTFPAGTQILSADYKPFSTDSASWRITLLNSDSFSGGVGETEFQADCFYTCNSLTPDKDQLRFFQTQTLLYRRSANTFEVPYKIRARIPSAGGTYYTEFPSAAGGGFSGMPRAMGHYYAGNPERDTDLIASQFGVFRQRGTTEIEISAIRGVVSATTLYCILKPGYHYTDPRLQPHEIVAVSKDIVKNKSKLTLLESHFIV